MNSVLMKFLLCRLDAVQDILAHPTYEATFTQVAKGIPDLERIISRIHAKTCKVRDFLKVLKVRRFFAALWSSHFRRLNFFLKAFEGLSKGMNKLADEAEEFESKTISGLLRGAPGLLPHIRNVQSMFQPVKDESMSFPLY
jgi:DNA mismatch repair protein MSH6